MAPPLTRTFADPRFRRLVWLLVGGLGWVGLVALGVALFAKQPPQAGFDLALILDAGRRVAAGRVALPRRGGGRGHPGREPLLFVPAAGRPGGLARSAGSRTGSCSSAAGIAAVAGFGLVVRSLAAGVGRRSAWDVVDVVLPALALAPFIYPFAIALLFGNVDAWFPLAYGARPAGGPRRVAPLARSAAASPSASPPLAKLYPGLLLGWLAVARACSRWVRDGRDRACRPTGSRSASRS